MHDGSSFGNVCKVVFVYVSVYMYVLLLSSRELETYYYLRIYVRTYRRLDAIDPIHPFMYVTKINHPLSIR